MKKLIAYQKLLLNSMPPFDINSQKSPEKLIFFGGIFIIFFMDTVIFAGHSWPSNTSLSIGFPIMCVWMINKILYGGCRLFEMVPVSRKYTVLNVVLLLPIVIMCILFIVLWTFSTALFGILIGLAHIFYPQGFTQSPPESVIPQMIDTTKANLLMLLILVIILFVGVAITFIKNKKIRLSSFAAFTAIGYGLLFFLKINMPTSPNSDKVEFLESFSIMPEASIILSCVAISTIIICIASWFISYNLYVSKSKETNY